MTNRVLSFGVAAVLTAGIMSLPTAAPAAPLSGAFAINNAAPSAVETVRWGGGWGGGWRGGWGGGWRGGWGGGWGAWRGGWGGVGWGGGGWGWGGGWGPGWGWGAAAVGVPVAVYGVSCWRWVPTAWGWTRAWVC